jgi:hypothetical protein
MIKVMAVLRTVFFVFILGYTLWATPIAAMWPKGVLAVNVESVRALSRATWIAVGWIALETAIGWVMAKRGGAQKPAGSAPTTGA